jgi:predicted ATPase
MKRLPIKIAVAGTHSTGKSSFLSAVESRLASRGLEIHRIQSLAKRAQELGFPILSEHTFESTLWIIAECMRQEAEAALKADVIFIDRPVLDALGYLKAALEVTGRSLRAGRLDQLKSIAGAHTLDYDVFVVTSLDPSVPLGAGRDQDAHLRESAAKHIDALVSQFVPTAHRLTSTNGSEMAASVTSIALAHLGDHGIAVHDE